VNKGFPSAALPQKRKSNMSHLQNIATRQRKSLVRDVLFAALVAIATVVSVSTVGQAVEASSIVAHR
jgi:hypothetical protein